MGRKPRVDQSPEEKWQVAQEGIKSGNVSETYRRHGIAPNLFYRWKMKRNKERRPRLGEKRGRGGNRKGPSHPAVGTHAGAEGAGDRNPKKRRWGVSRGAVHSHAREMVSSHEAAERTGSTTNRSWWPAEKNPRTDIAGWLGGCDERKIFR